MDKRKMYEAVLMDHWGNEKSQVKRFRAVDATTAKKRVSLMHKQGVFSIYQDAAGDVIQLREIITSDFNNRKVPYCAPCNEIYTKHLSDNRWDH